MKSLNEVVEKVISNYMTEKKTKEDPFFKKHGIKEISCGFGFSEEEQKYYGWSHRAIYGFGIGSKVKKGDCGFDGKLKKEAGFENKQWVAKTMEDAKKMALDFKEAVD